MAFTQGVVVTEEIYMNGFTYIKKDEFEDRLIFEKSTCDLKYSSLR